MKVEKALIELNEVRNDLLIKKNQDSETKSVTNTTQQNFAQGAAATSLSFNRMDSDMRTTTNFFNNTATSQFFKDGASLIGNIDSMTPEQLKERLMVAETLMKKLYNRNKDIEKYHKQKENMSPQKGAVPTKESNDDVLTYNH